MNKTEIPNAPCNDQSFIDLINWFNRWLDQPITDRERVLIGETVDYVATNKVKRYDPSKGGYAVNELRNEEARKL